MSSQPSPVSEQRPRRGCCGCLVTGAVGCVAFLGGSLAALALLFPSLFGDHVSRRLLASANARISGSLRIGSRQMGWKGPQRFHDVELFDQDGREVLMASVTFPGLLELFGFEEPAGGGTHARVDVRRADLVFGPDGRTNLERALAPRGAPGTHAGDADAWIVDLARQLADPWNRAFVLELSGDHVAVASAGGAADPRAITVLRGIRASVDNRLSGASTHATFEGRADIRDEERGEVRWRFETRSPRAWSWAELRGRLEAHNVPCRLADELAGWNGALAAACGPTFGGSLVVEEAAAGASAPDGAAEGLVALQLDSARSTLHLRLEAAAGRLRSPRSAEGEAASGEVAIPEALLEAPLAAFLAEWGGGLAGSSVVRDPGEAPWTLRASDVDLDGTPAAWRSSFAAWVADARATLTLATRGSLALVDGAGAPLARVLEPELRVALGSGSARSAQLTAGVARASEATGRGALRISVDHRGDAGDPADPAGNGARGAPGYTLGLHAERVPTAVIDRWLELEPILAEALGPECGLDLERAAIDGRPFEGRLYSELGEVNWNGSLSRERLYSVDPRGIDARVVLGPELHARLLRRLVPWLAHVEKPAGAGPLRITAGSFSLPLDRDLEHLDARVVIDLGEVEYRFFPGIEELIGHSSETVHRGRIEPIELAIERGVVDYERLPLSLSGVDCALNGSLDLSDGKIDIEAQVPLRVMSRRQGLDPELVDAVVDPEATMPVRLLGTWDEPTLSVEIDTLMRLFDVSQGGEVWEGVKSSWSRAVRKLIEGGD